MAITVSALKEVLQEKFNGVLGYGWHPVDGQECCALELLSLVEGLPMTDCPEVVRTFDLRPLNDTNVPDQIRTKGLLPVIARYAGSLDWPVFRQRQVAERLFIGTVNHLVSRAPNLKPAVSLQCKKAATFEAAKLAAKKAMWAAGRDVSDAILEMLIEVERMVLMEKRGEKVGQETVALFVTAMAQVANRIIDTDGVTKKEAFIAACRVWLQAAKG